MSHFTVLVVANDEDELAQRLAPYQENNMDDCPDEYLKFFDMTDEVHEKWDGYVEKVFAPDGTMFDIYDRTFSKDGDMFKDEYVYPPGYEVRNVPFSMLYKDEKEFSKKWFGYDWYDEEEGFGYYENPNAKWDWWLIGGRWTGALKLTEEATNVRKSNPALHTSMDGRPGIMTSPNDDIGMADSCLVRDLDIEWHKEKERKNSEMQWDGWHSPNRPLQPDEFEHATEEQRKAGIEFDRQHNIFWIQDETAKMLEKLSRDEYVEMNGSPRGITYAFISEDGEWNGKGEMGWWGISSSENMDYGGIFWKWLEQLEPDTRIWVVDCHI